MFLASEADHVICCRMDTHDGAVVVAGLATLLGALDADHLRVRADIPTSRRDMGYFTMTGTKALYSGFRVKPRVWCGRRDCALADVAYVVETCRRRLDGGNDRGRRRPGESG